MQYRLQMTYSRFFNLVTHIFFLIKRNTHFFFLSSNCLKKYFLFIINTNTMAVFKLFVIIPIAVAILIISIVAGVLGSRNGVEENCDCISPSNGGWRAFSISWFILSIIGVVLMFTWGIKKRIVATI